MQLFKHLTNRRDFLRAAAAAGALARASAQSAEAHIDVLLDEPVGTIAPEIYGHFVEHLGGVVYDGIWVGERSRVPNFNGLRKQLVDALRKVKPGVIRWPGGCFADQYDWRDGTGARDKRPRRTNFWVDASEGWPKGAAADGPQKFEPNQSNELKQQEQRQRRHFVLRQRVVRRRRLRHPLTDRPRLG